MKKEYLVWMLPVACITMIAFGNESIAEFGWMLAALLFGASLNTRK